MGLFICQLCNKDMSKTHQCERDDIIKRIESLGNVAWKAEMRLSNIRSKVKLLIKELSSLDEEEIIVKTKWIKDLWEATEARCSETRNNDVNEFLSVWLHQQHVLCEAFDLFRSKKNETVLVKLRNLHKACEEARNFIYTGSSPFDITPDDILDEIIRDSDYNL
jgi:hypothetical protein